MELLFHAPDLPPRSGALLLIEFHSFCAGEPPMNTLHNRRRHLQLADHFGCGLARRCLMPQGFEEQRRIVQNAAPGRGRSLPPGRIQLPRLTRIAMLLGEDRCHPLAVLQALPRRRDQELHRHLRADLAVPHLLLNRFRQKLD